jgi:hypothetical protein
MHRPQFDDAEDNSEKFERMVFLSISKRRNTDIEQHASIDQKSADWLLPCFVAGDNLAHTQFSGEHPAFLPVEVCCAVCRCEYQENALSIRCCIPQMREDVLWIQDDQDFGTG